MQTTPALPGVTPEAAAVALARFAPAERIPLTRQFAIGVLGGLPLILVLIAVSLLQSCSRRSGYQDEVL